MSNSDKPIDQVMDELNNFLTNLGGGKKGSNGGSRVPPSADFKPPWQLIGTAIVGLFLVVGALGSFYQIGVEEEGVVIRLGKWHKTTGPGLHFKLPWGIDAVEKVKTKRIFQEEFGFRSSGTTNGRTQYTKQTLGSESLMLTGDLNVADVEWILQYQISDPKKFLFHARDVRRSIRDASISVMRRVVGDRLVSDLLTSGRVGIAMNAKLLTQETLDAYDMGIRVDKVILQDVNPPDPVRPAFNEVNAAKQEQEESINQAEQQYNKIIPEARGKASKLLDDARAYAIEKVNNATGDANRFAEILSSYESAPKITRERMYLETMERIYRNSDGITIVDPKVKGLLPVFTGQNTLGGSSK